MLSAKPVLTCADSGGTTELVTDGETGLVCEPRPEAIGAAIDRLWGDRGLRNRMGAAGLARAKTVSWDPLVAQLESAAAKTVVPA
jgi:glycosyltransferase involved in cell wall biosynthesis